MNNIFAEYAAQQLEQEEFVKRVKEHAAAACNLSDEELNQRSKEIFDKYPQYASFLAQLGGYMLDESTNVATTRLVIEALKMMPESVRQFMLDTLTLNFNVLISNIKLCVETEKGKEDEDATNA